MQPVKCFLVVLTGNKKKVPCCDDPSHGEVEMDEYRREDTGETVFGWFGSFGPGAVFVTHHESGLCYSKWTNCDGKHYEIICPDGHFWDPNSRASNCTMKEEGTHRCWVLHGEAPNLHADKNGHTCQAGGGSIAAPGWHGFLTNGVLQENR